MFALDGKRIVCMGFLFFLVTQILLVFDIIFNLRLNIGWLMNLIAMLIICLGFGLQWLSGGNGLNFISAGTAFLMALIYLMKRVSKSGNFQELLASSTCVIYFLMAIRAWLLNKTGYNMIFMLLFVCAGAFNIFSLYIAGLFWRLSGSIDFGVLVMDIGYLICAGLCCMECKQE